MTRKTYTAEYKTKLVLEVVREESRLEEIAVANEINPNMLRNWKQEFLKNASSVFSQKDSKAAKRAEQKKEAALEKEKTKLSENTILFSKWLILATSLDPDKHNLLELYSRRWQIELLFKRSKSIFHFRRLRHSSFGYTLSLSRAWSAVIRLASFAASFFQIPFFDFFSLFASCFA